MANHDNVYILDIRRGGESAGRAKVETKVTLGTSDQCDIVFPDLKAKLNPIHLTFKLTNQIISLYVTGDKSPTFLDDIPLKSGKMFVLDHNDTLKLAGLEIIVRKVSVKEADEMVLSPPGENTIIRLIDQNLDKEFGSKDSKDTKEKNKLDSNKKQNQEKKLSFKNELKGKKQSEDFNLEINIPDSDHPIATKNESNDKINFLQKITSKFNFKKQSFENNKLQSTKAKLAGNGKKVNKSSAKNNKIKATGNFNYGLFKRLYALTIHSGIFYFIFYFLQPKYRFMDSLSKYLNFLEPIYTKFLTIIPISFVSNAELLSSVNSYLSWSKVQFIIAYILIDIIFHLILGASIPQVLMGIGTAGPASQVRIKALGRAILNYGFLPFIIFHAPLLFRKRPLHEVITISYLSNLGSKLRFTGPFIICPLVLILSFVGPSLTKPLVYQKANFIYWDKPTRRTSLTGRSSHKSSGSINALNAFIDTTLYQDIIPLPLLNQNELSFFFVDFVSQESLEVIGLAKLDLNLMAENLEDGFPFVHKFFPELYGERRKDELQQSKEVEKILEHSSYISIHNLFQTLPIFGPFSLGPLNVRVQLLNLLPVVNYESISKVQFPEENFLIYHELNQDCFIPMTLVSKKGFCVKGIRQSKELYAFFINNIIDKLKYKELSRSSSDDFEIINISSPENLNAHMAELVTFYETFAHKVIDEKKNKIEEVLLLSINSCIQYGKKHNIDVLSLEKLKDKIMGHNI